MDDGDWESAGFVRIQNSLPQSFRIALIHHKGGVTELEILPPGPESTRELPLSINPGDDVVLVVSATTRFTIEPAPYQIEIR